MMLQSKHVSFLHIQNVHSLAISSCYDSWPPQFPWNSFSTSLPGAGLGDMNFGDMGGGEEYDSDDEECRNFMECRNFIHLRAFIIDPM